jgi:AraC-like DNA-binding protein/ligand-binding sensor protein
MYSPFLASLSLEESNSRHLQHTIKQLEKSELFRDYRDSFEITTGLPLDLKATGSFQAPLHGSRNANPFCLLMAASNKTCAACLQIQERVERDAIGDSKTFECFAGLIESAVPVRVGENIIGYLRTGQVFLKTPSKTKFKAILGRLAAWNIGVDRQAMERAYFATRVLAKRQYSSILRLISIFGQHLSSVSNQMVVKETLAETPAIAKARAFIAEKHGEELSLADVARAVNMSEFYFCKMFKKETGLTFINYLSRVRVETLKQLLLDPHKRVSEAAYEAGFQSLSQFNRVFRRIAGEAPSSYRERIHGIRPAVAPKAELAHAA